MEKEINGFDWMKNEIGLDGKGISGFDCMKNEIGLDGKGISGFGWMKMKLCWMTKERDWVG
jgi:hypothetical protein